MAGGNGHSWVVCVNTVKKKKKQLILGGGGGVNQEPSCKLSTSTESHADMAFPANPGNA